MTASFKKAMGNTQVRGSVKTPGTPPTSVGGSFISTYGGAAHPPPQKFRSSPAAPLAARVAPLEGAEGQASLTRRLSLKIPQLKLGVFADFSHSLGSGWIVQPQPTRRATRRLCYVSLSRAAGGEEKPRIPRAPLFRLALNNPPTAVGGIPGVFMVPSELTPKNLTSAWRLLTVARIGTLLICC